LLRLTFHPPNLIVEHGSQQQQVAVSWFAPPSTIACSRAWLPAD
jgi:hypothetical protein